MESLPHISLEEIAQNPTYFIYDLKLNKNEPIFEFALMDRQFFQDSVFLDNRMFTGKPIEKIAISVKEILNNEVQIVSHYTPSCYIFHTAICGSTLLTKLLDQPSICMTYPEPYILYRLSQIKSQNLQHSRNSEEEYIILLRISLALLSKTFSSLEIPLIKAQVNCNFMMKDILNAMPNRYPKALFLYSNLKTFLSSILVEVDRRGWAKKQLGLVMGTSQAQKTLNQLFGRSHINIEDLPDTIQAACLWILQIYSYLDFYDDYMKTQPLLRNSQVRSLNCDRFFAQPEEVLTQLVNFFQLPFMADGIQAMMTSDTFNTYSKAKLLKTNLTLLPFDAKKRAAILLKRQFDYAEEIKQGIRWATDITKAHPIPEILPNPL